MQAEAHSHPHTYTYVYIYAQQVHILACIQAKVCIAHRKIPITGACQRTHKRYRATHTTHIYTKSSI